MSTSRQDTARQEILRRRLQALKLADDTASSRTIRPRDDPHRAPLSFAQRRMWLHQQINPHSSAYNVSILLTLEGALDRRALKAALAGVVQRQELLRTTYHIDEEGRPHQRIHASLPPPVRWAEATSEEADELATAEAAAPFDLAQGGPIRFLLIRAADELFHLVVTVHHIIWDGLSFSALSSDLTALYEQALNGSQPNLHPLPVQYADFAVWEQRNWSQDAHRETLTHWRRRFTPLPARPPLLAGRPGGDGERAGRVDRRMPAGAAHGLRGLATEHATTVFTVYVACQLLVLHRYTGATDLTLGTTAMNRDTSGVEGLVGNFGNTLALRFDLSGDPDFGALLGRVRHTCETAYQHQGYPYDLLVERLRPPGEPDRPVLFDALALFLSQEVSGPRLPGTKARWRTVFTGATAFPLAIQGFLTDEGLDVEATYAEALFDHGTVSAMVDLLGETITRAAAHPGARLSTLIDPTDAERALLLARGTGERTEPPPALLEDFVRCTDRSPDAIALICGDRRYDHRWLRDRARTLTARLRALGTGPESTVALLLPRSPDMVAAVLAVLGAGATFVPVDPAYPADRVRFMLSDSAPTAVLTTARLAADLPDGTAPLLLLDEAVEREADTTAPEETWPLPSPPQAGAWVGYTSGSTGRPKAVVVSREALASRIQWAGHLWPLDEGEARLAKSSLTFIDGTTEILETLSAGGTLVLADDGESRDGQSLTRLIAAHGVRHMMAVPSLLRAIAGTPGAFNGMTRLISTGEPLSSKLAAELSAEVASGALANSYGCSELAGDVIAGPVSGAPDTAVPIGAPAPNTTAFVLDDRLRLAPDGVVGELYIGGAQLARGYRGQPVLTAERFVAHPFAAGERLYRTGDLARWRGTELELLGRRDDQVKIRGQRVELGELAAVARAAPGVGDAFAVTRPGPGDSLQLLLYITPQPSEAPPPDGESSLPALRTHLERALPAALVPSTIVPLTDFPLLPNGKVNRLALPAPASPAPTAQRAPSTLAERALCAVVAEVLERDGDAYGPDDDFFAQGGDSITAISLVAKATRAGFPFSVPDVFEHRTVAGLLAVAHSGTAATATPVPLPIAAHRLRRSGTTAKEYVTSCWWRPESDVALPDLERALRTATTRHEALRLVVDTRRKTLWRASVQPSPNEGPLASVVPGALDEAVATARAHVDVTRGQVLHAVLAPGPTIVLAAHALAVDDTSLDLLRWEITALLAGEAPKGEGTHWPQPPEATPGPWAEPLRQAAALWPPPGEPGTERTRRWVRTRSSSDEHETVGAWLYALRRWQDTEIAVTDRLLRAGPAEAIGPCSRRHPVHATAGDSVTALADRDRALAATGGGYEPYRYATTAGRRAFTGLPEANTLIRPGSAPAEGERFTDTVRGLERFYSFVATFDGLGGVGLAADPSASAAADALLQDWVAALGG